MLVLLAATTALAAEVPASAPLAEDTRLNAPVTAVMPMSPLPAVLGEIGKQCDVKLEADDELQKECVTLIVRGRPAREVLLQLAAALDYTWASIKVADDTRGYRLFEDGKSKARRARLREEHRRQAAAELLRQLELGSTPSDFATCLRRRFPRKWSGSERTRRAYPQAPSV